ncbi:MAG: RDD family protein [Elusimicrobiota bacterium]
MPENLAPVSARIAAFTVDAGLAAGGYFLSLKLFYPHEHVWGNPRGPLFAALWSGVFLLYQAYMSGEGRRSAGKALLGLRVVDAQGEPLEAGRAALRSAGYLLSSIGDLGFAWTLVDRSRRGWHDLIAGSFVVEDVPSSASRLVRLRVASALCLAGFGGLWYWRWVVLPRFDRIYRASAAQASLEEMKVLERLYFYGNGRFSVSTDDLAVVSGDPAGFKSGLAVLLDPAYGVRFSTTGYSYRIDARAPNDEKTPVSVTGP